MDEHTQHSGEWPYARLDGRMCKMIYHPMGPTNGVEWTNHLHRHLDGLFSRETLPMPDALHHLEDSVSNVQELSLPLGFAVLLMTVEPYPQLVALIVYNANTRKYELHDLYRPK